MSPQTEPRYCAFSAEWNGSPEDAETVKRELHKHPDINLVKTHTEVTGHHFLGGRVLLEVLVRVEEPTTDVVELVRPLVATLLPANGADLRLEFEVCAVTVLTVAVEIFDPSLFNTAKNGIPYVADYVTINEPHDRKHLEVVMEIATGKIPTRLRIRQMMKLSVGPRPFYALAFMQGDEAT